VCWSVKLRIIVAVHHFPPRYTSGAELRAYRTAARLRDYGHDVRVICVESVDVGARGLEFEDEVYDGLPVRRLSFDLTAASDPFRWAYDNPWIREHLHGYLSDWPPDVFHLISGYLMSGSALWAARGLGIPTVLTLTDFWFLCPRITLLRSNGRLCAPPFDAVTCARCLGEEKRRYRVPGKLAPRLMQAYWQSQPGSVARVQARMDYLRETLNSVNFIISPSQFLRDMFIQAGAPPQRIRFSRQGRDFPGLAPEKTAVPPSGLRIGYLGQIAPHKGVHVLFEAVRRIESAPLTVQAWGDGSRFPAYARRLRRLARSDSRLKLAGVYERSEVSRVFRELDLVVVPSVWYENSPNVILEAFAHRTPVVASRLGGMAELVTDGVNGFQFEPGDAGDLARVLCRFVEQPGLAAELGRGAPPVRTVQEEIEELLQIYANLEVGRDV